MRAFQQNSEKKRNWLSDRAGRLNAGLLSGPVLRQRERLQSLPVRAEQSIRNLLKSKGLAAGSLSQLLKTLSHKSVLDRGFTLVRGENGHVIRHRDCDVCPQRFERCPK